MSAVLEPSVVAPPAPETAGPRPVVQPPESGRGKQWVVLLAAMVAAAAALYLRPWQPAKPALVTGVPTAKAIRGILLDTLRLSGSIAATRYADIIAPQLQMPDNGFGMVLMELPPPGSMVKEGGVLAQVDVQAARDHLDDVEAQVDQGELDLVRVKSQQDAETEAVQQRVRVARGDLEKAQQDMRALPAKNTIDQELLSMARDEAQARYDEALRQVPRYEESHRAAWRIAEMNQEFQVRHRDRHRADIRRLTMKAPMAGQVVMRPIYRNGEQGTVRVGDLIAPGQLFMRVVDASSVRMETYINQAESELVRIGQRAKIHFDAYPEITMDGTVAAVGTIAEGSRRVNYFIRRIPVRVDLEGNDPRVLPDLTASADVVLAEQDDAVIVPRQAVVEEDGRSIVYVKQAGSFTPREVEIGMFSNTGASVTSGLQAGEEVALERPL
ncbi:MAG TPA: efflux RND transporter periplasmic adaptor subunit [Bryobacteraceae bacterium]|nr:efflux RND transporter periplasmic adaptor subunit [Bryobacteraceae bacterium]